MSTITGVEIENVKRVKAFSVTLDPNDGLVKIGGRNAQGKSSILDAIMATLTGISTKDMPKPIRDGEDSAYCRIETKEYVITRRWTYGKNGKTNNDLKVESHDGATFPKAQAKLDSLIAKVSIDPFAFTQLEDKDQLETFLGLVDLPFDPKDIEQRDKDLREERANIGRQEKAIGAVEIDETLPTEETSAGQIIAEIEQINEQNQQLANFQSSIERQEQSISHTDQEIARLQAQLKDMSEQRNELVDGLNKLNSQLAGMQDIQSTEDLRAQLAQVEETNAKIRANNAARERQAEKERLSNEYDAYTAQISDLAKEKQEGLAQAEMPVEGLSFDNSGLTYQGQPFKQASSWEKLKVSALIGMAEDPELKVMHIKDGSLIDQENLELLRDLAIERGYQIWVEIVSTDQAAGIIIEDGEIAV